MAKARMRAPIRWFGGKGNVIKHILEAYYKMRKHICYCEVFGGSGALLFAKRPSRVEVYNDLHSGLVNLYRVIRNKEQFDRFRTLCELTPYSREEHYESLQVWESEPDSVLKAHKFYIVARQSFGGELGAGWSFSKTSTSRNMAETCSKWLSAVETLPQFHERLSRVQIENKDFRDLIKTYDSVDTLFYLDPPYIHGTRKSGEYDHEMTDRDHRDLVDILLTIKGQAIVSGYDHPIYNPLVKAGWIKVQFDTVAYSDSDKETKQRTETLWCTDTQTQQMLF